MSAEADFVIVGAGSAGCVLAAVMDRYAFFAMG